MHERTRCTASMMALAVLAATHNTHAIAPTPPPQHTPPPPPRYAAQFTSIGAWLDACVRAPRNGLNPQIDPPMPAVLDAAIPELQRTALRGGPAEERDRRRCATWVLSRNVPIEPHHEFWVSLLRRSLDEQQRWEAMYALQTVHRPDDLPLLMRQFAEAPRLRNPLGSWLRAWRTRAAVPCLVAIVLEGNGAVAENAARSLSTMPDVPSLPAEAPAAPAQHEHPPSSLAAPYARWWRERGQTEFASEQRQWEALVRGARGALQLDAGWANP